MIFLGTSRLGGYVYIADAFFVASAVAWAIALARGTATFRWTSWYAPLAAYLLLCFASAIYSADRTLSLRQFSIDAYVVGLAVLSLNVVRRDGLRRMCRAWMWGAVLETVAALAGVALFYGGLGWRQNPLIAPYGSLIPGDYPRTTGLFLNFNMACNYLSVALLLVLAMRRQGWMDRTWSALLAIAIAVAAAFTVSPGIGGLLLGVGLWVWVTANQPRIRAGGLLLGSAAALAFAGALLISPINTGQPGITLPVLRQHVEPSSRWLCWEAAVHAIREHPLLGLGTGMPLDCPAYLNASGIVEQQSDAHNSFLNIAALKGLPALAAFLWIAVWLLWRKGPLTLATDLEVIRAALLIAFVQAFLYQGISSSFEHTRHLWILAGLLAAV